MNLFDNELEFYSGRLFKSNLKKAIVMLCELAVLTAIVAVLQFLGSFIRFGLFSISLVLVPIVVGAAVFGPITGGWLGLVFGVTVLISGDANSFLAVNPAGTVITVLMKGMAAGFVAGLFYKLIEKKNTWAAVIVSSVVCPVVNTGVFLIGCLVFFLPTLLEWSQGSPNFAYFMVFGIGLINFPLELAVNLILAPGVHRILLLINKNAKSKPSKKRA